jgi:hypothetical protein
VTITVSSMSLMTTMRVRAVGTSTDATLRTGSLQAGRTSSTSTGSHTSPRSAASGSQSRRAMKKPFSLACTLRSLAPCRSSTSAPGTGRLASAR